MVDRVELDRSDATQTDRLSQSISTAFEHGEDVVGIYHFSDDTIQRSAAADDTAMATKKSKKSKKAPLTRGVKSENKLGGL